MEVFQPWTIRVAGSYSVLKERTWIHDFRILILRHRSIQKICKIFSDFRIILRCAKADVHPTRKNRKKYEKRNFVKSLIYLL
jgi:hypothetical protein